MTGRSASTHLSDCLRGVRLPSALPFRPKKLTQPTGSANDRRFMRLVTNGSMYLDPLLHSMPYIRSRSSFLFAVVLAIASSFKRLCTSQEIHRQLSSLASRLRDQALVRHLKSVEIIQAFLLLASWSEVPSVLARDMNWKYISHSIGLAVELRLDTPLPFCVQVDPAYSQATHERLVRNAHRVCYFLFIHDRVSLCGQDG